jgi:DNA-binding transcriptional ArsR family regulator
MVTVKTPGSFAVGTKHGLLVRRLAAELILLEPGQQLPTVGELAAKFDVGYGTVQRALDTLEEMGAVRLEARGHLGTYVVEKDLRKLWEAAGTPTLLGGFPVPNTRRLQALATGLQRELRRACLSADLVYLQGSRKRLGYLRQGRLDFAVISRFSAERAWQNQQDVVVACNFGPNTYRDSRNFCIVRRTRTPVRVGVDYHSCDHYWRTLEVFPKTDYDFVNVPYSVLLEAVCRGEVDAAVWYGEAPAPSRPPGIEMVPLEPSPTDNAIGEACLVVLAENTLLRELVARHVDPGRVYATLDAVLRGEELPSI